MFRLCLIDKDLPLPIVPRAHALQKIHNNYTHLFPFCPVVDTTPSSYYYVGLILTELLTPLNHNEFALKNSVYAAAEISNISPEMLDNGYNFAPFCDFLIYKRAVEENS